MRPLCCVMLVFGAVFGRVLEAQDRSRPLGVSLASGLSQPLGRMWGSTANPGFRLVAGVWVRPTRLERLSFRGDFSYDRSGLALGPFATAANVSMATKVIGASVSTLYQLATPSSRFRPYVVGGLGIYEIKSITTEPRGSYETGGQVGPGFHGGGGVETRLAGLNTFVEARFQRNVIDGDRRTYVPLVFGIRF